jgi:hypothetical protein
VQKTPIRSSIADEIPDVMFGIKADVYKPLLMNKIYFHRCKTMYHYHHNVVWIALIFPVHKTTRRLPEIMANEIGLALSSCRTDLTVILPFLAYEYSRGYDN